MEIQEHGKTTVARIVGKIFAEEKILSKEKVFVEASRADLIGKYVGHTAPQTAEVINRAKRRSFIYRRSLFYFFIYKR